MADINPMWHARLLHNAAYSKEGVDCENIWIERQLSKLTPRMRNKWSLNKIRKFLLENFCSPKAVEEKITKIAQERYEESLKTGVSMKY